MSQRTMAVVGTGVIGNGWIARFLANGHRVFAYDPAPEAEANTRRMLDDSWSTLVQYGIHKDASKDNLTFVQNLEDAVAHADLIQENVPERETLKKQVLASIDHHAKPDAIIASSTSGYMPSVLQEACVKNPERIIVAHPFNPVYLIPLVEIAGGKQTAIATINEAKQIYDELNMKPLVMSGEIDGHIGDRLMEALWREALHIVNDGVATTEEVDKAIVYGPGLRWALMGPFLTLHLAGGNEGMKHMLEQFGPALKLPWTRLIAPELTEDLKKKVIDGTSAQCGEISIADMEHRRDRFLIKLMGLLEEEGFWPSERVLAYERNIDAVDR
ncbi:3-hydroxyacyl-CoA dehydrogenase NAD-binding domain-containing protein [Shouchella lehensis]|uniref:L-carnitine dehydrogenase n=2 Tax=Shouchella lehensis TaxID=300825 RepID=A0A060LSE9_9BACI|nr:3-hydroxyacyl-CoA dehydrogenase NAD-binding domain-containing protein [Shouchella lehensis]AIC94181.1 Lambda-crystallin-like protein [Shouchella lehensis G1]MBG9785801.1 3-hydroxybutyryl-CoA dehydrogenase [Shouchella lehensis]RQW20092.1 L-carnitine dehydrogenase [Bacillus sp. C1-1]TES48269.1 L-carnitine dehydrogenase [Shouchella lehensis]